MRTDTVRRVCRMVSVIKLKEKKAMKKIKRISNVFSVFLLIFFVFSVLCSSLIFNKNDKASIEASAAVDNSKVPLYDSNFDLSIGAGIVYNTQKLKGLRYWVYIKNSDIFNAFKDEKDVAIFKLQIIRKGDNKDVPIYEVLLYMKKNFLLVGHKTISISAYDLSVGDISLQENAIKILPDQTENTYFSASPSNLGTTQDEKKISEESKNICTQYGYIWDYSVCHDWEKLLQTLTDEETGFPYFQLEILVNSFNTDYYVTLDYELEDWKGEKQTVALRKNIFGKYVPKKDFWGNYVLETIDDIAIKRGKIKSQTRSVYDVLQRIEIAGDLDLYFSGDLLDKVNRILLNTVDKNIIVNYLEQIGNTPFARRAQTMINVPVTDGYVYRDAIEAALGKSLTVLNAHAKGPFLVDENSNCNIDYWHSVACEAQTEDANKTDMFYLHVNKSFSEYYGAMIKDGIFEQGAAEYMINKICQNYPEIKGYSMSDLYGLWGYVIIPQTHSINSIFKDIFTLPSDFTGSIVSSAVNGRITWTAYNKLLTDYNYGLIKRVVQDLAQLFDGDVANCTHYFFYADPKYTEITIDESGSGFGDDDGAAIESIQNSVSAIVDGVKKEVEETKKTLVDSLKVITGVIVGVVLVVGGVYLIKTRKNNE